MAISLDDAQKKNVVILMGPPGSGKGTQSDILVDRFRYVHLETSAVILEELAAHGDDETFDVGWIEVNLKRINEPQHARFYRYPPMLMPHFRHKIVSGLESSTNFIARGGIATFCKKLVATFCSQHFTFSIQLW